MLSKIITYKRLGILNLLNVAIYRIALRMGYFVKKQPVSTRIDSSQEEGSPVIFFETPLSPIKHENLKLYPLKAFGWLPIDTDSPPNWLQSIISNSVADNNEHWSQLDDFSLNIGDIKTVWELSRFDWAPHFSVQYLKSNDSEILNKLNDWLNDWCQKNPINQGINWKCGQEASIRILHLAATSYLINTNTPISSPLAQLIYQHLLRIVPTMPYAMAQDNNHGTSEAAAVYIGCLLLENHSDFSDTKQIKKWIVKGQYWLENRANKLINADGAFSQNSVNYHRLMLDSMSLTEFFRQQYKKAKFHKSFYQKMQKACFWLFLMTDKKTGRVPILGANDGAQILPITPCDYLDYRPSVQWAQAIFLGYYPYTKNGSYQQLATLFPPKTVSNVPLKIPSNIFLSSSFHMLRNDKARCYLRTPDAKFRPGCSDALHLDFWLGEQNILISTGSYSYNCEKKLQDYFPSVKAHNTVQFDRGEQMPRLSRFLYNDWIKTKILSKSSYSISAYYRNTKKYTHLRTLNLSNTKLIIKDSVSGFKNQTVLRWHLAPSNWQLVGNKLLSDKVNIEVTANGLIEKLVLVEGLQSRYYYKKEIIPVLEVTLAKPGDITTLISWSN